MNQAAVAFRSQDNCAQPQVERRFDRSSYRAESLELLLTAFRRRNSLDAVLVSDDNGLLLAGSAVPGIDLDTAAAALPGALRNPYSRQVTAQSFKLKLVNLHIGVIGNVAAANLLPARIFEGTKRILSY
ncbi:MAG: hypothetical protein WA632_04785 [Gallionella sp.]